MLSSLLYWLENFQRITRGFVVLGPRKTVDIRSRRRTGREMNTTQKHFLLNPERQKANAYQFHFGTYYY